MSRAAGEFHDAVPSYAPTAHLVGGRGVCASCGHLDHAVRFVAGDLPVCEDSNDHAPEESQDGKACPREDG